MNMTNPFLDKLPPGWSAHLSVEAEVNAYPIWTVLDENQLVIADCQLDSPMPLEVHLRYAWSRYDGQATTQAGGVRDEEKPAQLP